MTRSLLPAEPADDLERAVATVAADSTARPRLWQALYEGRIVLPVVGYEPGGKEGARVRFLSVPSARVPLVFGFTSEPRFEATLPDGTEISRIVVPGSALPRFWPKGHGLAINAGYQQGLVLTPWEVSGLPHGRGMALPHPRNLRR